MHRGKAAVQTAKRGLPPLPLKENHMAGGDIKAGEFTVGSHPSLRVCREDGSPGVLDSVNVNCYNVFHPTLGHFDR